MAWACLGLLLACATADGDRADFLAGILSDRAAHLSSDDADEIARELVRAEKETGIDALLLLAVAEEESRFRIRARSHRGALGLLQIRPATARDVAARNGIDWKGPESLYDPSVNVRIGAAYLLELRARFGTWDLALTAYNRGPTGARRAESRGRNPSSRYSARVLHRLESLPSPESGADRRARP